jgi:hypothetical protein
MVRLGKLLLLLAALGTIGCDPGMTIRQSDDQTNDSKLKIQVPMSHPLIGENWYAPDNVRVTSLFESDVTITGVQLVSENNTYPYRQVGPTEYPVVIPPGRTIRIPIWFDLDSGVSNVFKNKVELRISYEGARDNGISSAFLIGGPLD